MDDQELIKKAAKVSGLSVNCADWNPLQNRDQLFDLAIQMKINIDFEDQCAWKRDGDRLITEYWGLEHHDMPHAIVYAAVEAGTPVYAREHFLEQL